jgi:hypothetical protein
MSSLPATRRPLQPVVVVGRIITGLDTAAHDLLHGHAILEIESTGRLESYWTTLHMDAAEGCILGVRLQRFASGERYDLPASLDACDCADGTYRGGRAGGCRHQQALRQALPTVPRQ